MFVCIFLLLFFLHTAENKGKAEEKNLKIFNYFHVYEEGKVYFAVGESLCLYADRVTRDKVFFAMFENDGWLWVVAFDFV